MAKHNASHDSSLNVSPTEIVDINTATFEELINLHGIGPEIAQRIVSSRPFIELDELHQIQGIGPTVLRRIKPFITLSLKRELPGVEDAELKELDSVSENLADSATSIQIFESKTISKEFQIINNIYEFNGHAKQVDDMKMTTSSKNVDVVSSEYIGEVNVTIYSEVHSKLASGIVDELREVEGFDEDVISCYVRRMMHNKTQDS